MECRKHRLPSRRQFDEQFDDHGWAAAHLPRCLLGLARGASLLGRTLLRRLRVLAHATANERRPAARALSAGLMRMHLRLRGHRQRPSLFQNRTPVRTSIQSSLKAYSSGRRSYLAAAASFHAAAAHPPSAAPSLPLAKRLPRPARHLSIDRLERRNPRKLLALCAPRTCPPARLSLQSQPQRQHYIAA